MPSNDAARVTSDARLVARFKAVSKIAATSAILIGIIALVGWALGIEVLKSIVRGQSSIKPNTAIAFVLLGAALLCLAPDLGRAVQKRAGMACAGAAVAMGGLTLVEYLFGIDLGVDLLLFSKAAQHVGAFAPGRMSPLAATDIVLIGTALLLLNAGSQKRARPAELLVLPASIAAVEAFLEYFFEVRAFYGLAAVTRIAVGTSIGLAVLCVGILFARPDRGFMRIATSPTMGGVMWRRVIPVALIVPVVLAWARLRAEKAGYFGTEMGAVLLTWFVMLVFGFLTTIYTGSVDTSERERKRNEEEIRIREESLRLALKAGHSGTFDWEFQRNVVRWSAESEEVYGLPAGGFGGHYEDWEPLVVPEDVEIPKADIREALRSGEYSSEFRIRRQNDGAIRWVHARGKVFFDDTGQPVRMVGTNTDITDRKDAEQAVQTSRRRLESVLDGLPVMVCLLTRHYEVAFANHAFRKHFGECKGRKCYDYCFGRSEPCEFCEAFQVLETRTPHDWEVATPDGRLIHAYDFPFIDTDGSPLILEMNLDITEQRRTEEIVVAERQKLRDILDNLPPYVVLLTADYHVAFANREFRQRFGESHGRRCYEFLFERSEPCEVCNTYEVLKTGGPVNWKWTGPDGRNYDIYDFPFTDTDGSRLILEMGIDVTEQRQAEEALRRGEARYRLLLESLPQKIAYKDRNSVYISCNENYARDLKMKPEQIAGHTDYDFFTKELAEKYRADDHSVMESGEPRLVEESYVHNGTELWVNTIKAPVRDDRGKVTGVFVLFWEITERKRAEEALRAASGYARNLIEASLDPLVTISSEGKITDVNHATEEVTGVVRDKLIGSDFCDYFTEPGKAREGYRQVFKRGAVRDYPLAIRHASGRITDVLYNATVYRNEAGEVQGVFAAARDITERKGVEQKMHQQAVLLDLAQDAIIVRDSNAQIVFWNRGAIDTYGYSAEEAIGKRSHELLQTIFPISLEEIELRVGTAQEWEGELRQTRKDGQAIVVASRWSLVRDEQGNPTAAMEINRDVTERKRAEEALEEKAQELARSNEELAQFAYVASHDLQEPLRKIVAFGDRLVSHSSAELDEQGRDYLERMQNAAKRMGQLIESLLELSRVTTKGAEFEPVDLSFVLREVLADLEVRIQQTQGQVEVGALPTVMADRSQMRQLFQNLIGNALKFHREDVPPMIQISGQQKRGAWEIHVADNGIGFDEKYTERIFRPFQRLHGKNVFEGSGMGLAICNKIVARHAGEITAHSQPGRGSDFVLTLPTTSKTREASAT